MGLGDIMMFDQELFSRILLMILLRIMIILQQMLLTLVQ